MIFSLSQLELPTHERLLPIGQLGNDGMAALVDKVREALSITDIGHPKRENNDKAGVIHTQLLITFEWKFEINVERFVS